MEVGRFPAVAQHILHPAGMEGRICLSMTHGVTEERLEQHVCALMGFSLIPQGMIFMSITLQQGLNIDHRIRDLLGKVSQHI